MNRSAARLSFQFTDMLQQQSMQAEERLEQAKGFRQFLDELIKEYEQQIAFTHRYMSALASGKVSGIGIDIGTAFEETSTPKQSRFKDKTIAEAVKEVLAETGEPMHVKQILSKLEEGGWTTHARRRDASLVSVLIRDDAFKRVGSNTFTLSQPPLRAQNQAFALAGDSAD